MWQPEIYQRVKGKQKYDKNKLTGNMYEFFYKHLMTEVIVGISKMLETTKEIHIKAL